MERLAGLLEELRTLVEGRAAVSEEVYVEGFKREFLRLCQKFGVSSPTKIDASPDNNYTDPAGGELTIQVGPDSQKTDPKKSARHVFGHWLVDAGATEPMSKLVSASPETIKRLVVRLKRSDLADAEPQRIAEFLIERGRSDEHGDVVADMVVHLLARFERGG